MQDDITLTQDQQARISRTLARIRAGLARFPVLNPGEPAPIFKPEAFDDQSR